jgi:hypothetical protein
MVLGGVYVLILSPGYVLRLSDGKVLTPLTKLANMSTCGSTDNGQDVVFYYTWENNDKKDIEVDDGLFAAQLSFDGPDALATKILFNPDFNVRLNTSGILYRDGVLYSQRSLWDARTGAELRTIQDRRFGQAHHIVAAGDFFYALDKAGKCGVVKFDRSAAVVAVNPLSPAPHEGEKIEQHACQSARKDWGAYPFTASVPFFQGNRVYIRSHDYLYCIAENP